ncbi:hypothetical protein J2Y38_000435 [Flavobacterium sp. 2755]|uniref:hypothetical protein n=1 Tax=Flavobacterium TaxID=237 RepID=UPI0015AF1EAF|nr:MULTISPECIES: hypothetical protein [Flavobacterium]MDR6760256.1 hypothetical protein [Flavobacterium sp. 2755]
MISVHYSNYKSFSETHCESILEYCNTRARAYSKSKIDAKIKLYFGPLIKDFEELLTAPPLKLEKIKLYFDSLSATKREDIQKNFKLIGLYNHFIKHGFDNAQKQITYGSEYLADNLDIFSCPYCNENFTYSFRYKAGVNPVRRTFDWDHIYSKTDYPFLSISFFNLTPCCKVCNFIKSSQNVNFFNPHLNVNVNDSYFFLLNPTGAGFITDTSQLNLNLVLIKGKYIQEFKDSITTIGLLDRYRLHKEVIKDILNKQRMYPLSYLTAVQNQLSPVLTPKHSQLRAVLYGTNFSHNSFYKRPFSKLTFDILNNSNY